MIIFTFSSHSLKLRTQSSKTRTGQQVTCKNITGCSSPHNVASINAATPERPGWKQIFYQFHINRLNLRRWFLPVQVWELGRRLLHPLWGQTACCTWWCSLSCNHWNTDALQHPSKPMTSYSHTLGSFFCVSVDVKEKKNWKIGSV